MVARDQVYGILYQRQPTPFERSVDVHISRLRRKIDGAGITIHSTRGVGYALAEDES